MARKPFTPRYTEDEMLEALAKHGKSLPDYYRSIKEDWDYWLKYKWENHREQYALPRTEAAAIVNLHELSNGDPFLSFKLIDYNSQALWSGMFRPRDLFQWSSWQRELEVPKVEILPYHQRLAQSGWPQKALSDASWCRDYAVENPFIVRGSLSNYETYLSETVAFFGPLKAGNYLKEQDWNCWRNQVAPFDFGINPRDFASLAMKRLDLHIKFHQANEISIKSFFMRHKPELV